MKQKLYKHFVFFFFSILCIGCHQNPFLSPWSLAPPETNQVWCPNIEEKRQVRKIRPCDMELEVPCEDETASLAELFNIALYNSPKTAQSWQEARVAAAAYTTNLAPWLPSAFFRGHVNSMSVGTILNNQYLTNQMTSFGPQVYIDYIIFDGGRRYANAEMYYQTLQSFNWMHNETMQEVMQSVASSYYSLLYAKALLDANEADLLNAEQAYQAAIMKTELGIFDETEKMQAKTNYLQKKVTLTQQVAKVKNSYVDLLDVIGIPVNVNFKIESFHEEPLVIPCFDDVKKLIAIGKDTRPDYLSAKAQVLAAKNAVKRAALEFCPTLDFTLSAGQQWFNDGNTDHGNYTALLSLNFPIFTGLAQLNQIRQQDAAVKEAEANLRVKELSLITKIQKNYNDWMMTKEQLVDTRSYLEAAKVEFDAMIEKYKVGVVSILDLLNALAYLSDARAQYANAQQQYYMSIINVAFATGLLTTGNCLECS